MTLAFGEPDAPPEGKPEPTINPIGMAMGEWLRELIWTGEATRPRSLQKTVGMSEVGGECDREIAYKIAGHRKLNINRDPMPSITGSGIHLVLAEMFTRMDGGVGRWLIEQRVTYRGIPGSVDAYDTRRGLIVDWKSTAKAKIRKLRTDGPPRRYERQVQMYAAALREAGEDPQQAALVYLARDGALTDLFVWPITLDEAAAVAAADRYHAIASKVEPQLLDPAGFIPGDFTPTPSRLCGWCDYHRAGSTDLKLGCPGQS